MNLYAIAYFVLAYLIGAIPSGYLITRWTAKKNILDIGWRKTSGSNVFKNVGKWQGVATGLLDCLKGVLAVWLPGYFGFGELTQVLCGAAALVGNNWSVFLGFAGGRGLALFAGVMLIFSRQLLLVALVPFVVSAAVWTASIGTIIGLLAVVLFSPYFNSFSTAGIFTLLVLVPIFLKRLSPLRELSPKKPGIIINRLIFDDDIAPAFRLKRAKFVPKRQ